MARARFEAYAGLDRLRAPVHAVRIRSLGGIVGVVRRWGVGFAAVSVGLLAAVGVMPGAAVADEVRDSQWMVDALGLPEAWAITKGAGVVVGIVDTGVDATHPDLVGNVLPGRDAWSGGRDGWSDTTGHGTSMASLVVGHGHGPGNGDGVVGVAPEAKVLPYGALPPDRVGEGYNSAEIAAGVRWLADNGADVILLALGGGTSYEPESEAITYARNKEIPVLAPAGNTADDDYGIVYPAALDDAISVTGMAQNGDFWDGSTWGVTANLAAPAENIVSAGLDHGYATHSGTSDASAIAAGVFALVSAKWPDMTRMDMLKRVSLTAKDKGVEGPDDHFGYGLVHPAEALTAEIEPLDPAKSPLEWESTESTGASSAPSSLNTAQDADSGGAVVVFVTLVVVAVLAGLVLVVLLVLRRRTSAG